MDVTELLVSIVEEGGAFSIGLEEMVPVDVVVVTSVVASPKAAVVSTVDVLTGLSVRAAVDCTTSLTASGCGGRGLVALCETDTVVVGGNLPWAADWAAHITGPLRMLG